MTKFVHCECGTDLQGETDDEIVDAVQEHVKADHPGLELSREQILDMAHDH